MSQRDSGYERIERDSYETPEWVTAALVPHIDMRVRSIYEPAAGSGKMVRALISAGYAVTQGDITEGYDFLEKEDCYADAIITNPPYELAREFIDKAMALMCASSGFVAMLLRTDYDHAKTRMDLFRDNIFFAKKVVLTKRIKWFEDSTGQPSFNHAWFIWDWQNQGPPVLSYGPVE